jgi:hypothetical protein
VFFTQMAFPGYVRTNTSWKSLSSFPESQHLVGGSHYSHWVLKVLLIASLSFRLQTLDDFFVVLKYQVISESHYLGCISASPLSRCVTLGKLLNHSVSSSVKWNKLYLHVLNSGPMEIQVTHVKYFIQCFWQNTKEMLPLSLSPLSMDTCKSGHVFIHMNMEHMG